MGDTPQSLLWLYSTIALTLKVLPPEADFMPGNAVRFSTLLTAATVLAAVPVWAFRLDPNDTRFFYPLAEVVPFSSPFGWRTHPVTGKQRLHAGVDLAAPHGAVVQSANAGTVVFAGWKGGYGKTVIVRYPDEQYETLYAHLSDLLVSKGQIVQAKTTLGRVGSTGMSTGSHLHFELRRFSEGQWVAVNAASQLRAVEAYAHATPESSAAVAGTETPDAHSDSTAQGTAPDTVALSFALPSD